MTSTRHTVVFLWGLSILVVILLSWNAMTHVQDYESFFPTEVFSQNQVHNRSQRQYMEQQPQKTLAIPHSTVRSAGFVHVGKTGGSTLSSLLTKGCHSFVSSCPRNHTATGESLVSKLVVRLE
jgi:hypothetical protein